MKRKLLVIGGSYMNLQMKVDPKSKDENITEGSAYGFHPYGDSAITAIAAAKLGGDCIFATKLGDDTNGKRLYEYYKNCGIVKDAMRKSTTDQTGLSVTVWNDLGTYETFITRGASMQFTKAEIDDAFATVPDLFVVPLEELGYEEKTVMRPLVKPSEESEADGEAEPELVPVTEKEGLALYAIRRAEEKDVDLLLEWTPFTSHFPLETLKNVKALVISDDTLYHLTGFFPNTTDKTLRALMALSKKVSAKYYVVRQGNDAVFVYDGKYYETYRAPEKLVSSVQAENAGMQKTFLGALAVDYLETKNILHAARFATVVSLLTKGKYGNLEKLMTRAEFDAYLAENGISLDR